MGLKMANYDDILNKFNEILSNIKLINSSFILRSKDLKLQNYNIDEIYLNYDPENYDEAENIGINILKKIEKVYIFNK